MIKDYRDKAIEWELPDGITYEYMDSDEVIGFIYIIEFETGHWYVGKKNCWSYRRKLLKNAKGRKKFEVVRSPMDWRNYTSSSDAVKKLISRNVSYVKRILCVTDRENLTYLETREQFKRDCLEDPDCLNGNILSKFYRNNI